MVELEERTIGIASDRVGQAMISGLRSLQLKLPPCIIRIQIRPATVHLIRVLSFKYQNLGNRLVYQGSDKLRKYPVEIYIKCRLAYGLLKYQNFKSALVYQRTKKELIVRKYLLEIYVRFRLGLFKYQNLRSGLVYQGIHKLFFGSLERTELTDSSSRFLVVKIQGSPAFEVSRDYDIHNIQTKYHTSTIDYLRSYTKHLTLEFTLNKFRYRIKQKRSKKLLPDPNLRFKQIRNPQILHTQEKNSLTPQYLRKKEILFKKILKLSKIPHCSSNFNFTPVTLQSDFSLASLSEASRRNSNRIASRMNEHIGEKLPLTRPSEPKAPREQMQARPSRRLQSFPSREKRRKKYQHSHDKMIGDKMIGDKIGTSAKELGDCWKRNCINDLKLTLILSYIKHQSTHFGMSIFDGRHFRRGTPPHMLYARTPKKMSNG
ncbi:hypothetical protein WN51_12621 [Melipona quadrifasciata]|uniref:Uncharacterized protein n=1 Tax=Melipona quadrifasciata TaxID=166423 RepID=A0A0M9A4L5_9HYME|nr:hypothetical protein WN51_12621 [Melipona quadrifasciata]